MKKFAGFGRLKGNKGVVYGVYFLIFMIAFLMRLYNIEYRDVWEDEDRQSGYAAQGLFDLDITQRAAAQCQPPIDPFIQSIGIANFGINEMGVRIHTAFLGALTVLLFYILLSGILEDRFAADLAGVVFAFQPWLIHYNRVGRPVGTGVFCAVLYLLVLLHFLVHTKDKESNKKCFILLVIVQTWFLLSVGFQPLIFVLTSSFSLLPFLLNKKYFYKTAAVYLASVVSFALAYPILNFGFTLNAQKYLKPTSFLHHIVTFFKNLSSISFETYINYYKPLVENYHFLYFTAWILGAAGFIYALISKKKNTVSLLFLYFLIFTFVYPLLFEAGFKTFINYYVTLRYYLTFTPVLIAGLGVGIYYALLFLSHLVKIKPRLGISGKYLARGFFLVIFLFSFYGNTQSLKETYVIQNREWEKIYELFKYHSAPGDTAYIFNLAPAGKWVPTYFYSQNFYYKEESERYVHLKSTRGIADDFRNINSGKQKGNIFLMILTGAEKLNESFFKGLNDISIHSFCRAFIVRFFNHGKLPENILEFFWRLTENLPKDKHTYIVYETLFHLEMARGKLKNAQNILYTLRRIFPDHQYNVRINQLEKKWQNEKEERIKRRKERKVLKGILLD
jgi:4-amino-4-deoxy-L-arabinose transferase-like glycosyltransferase